jgi:diguanylate cyclase (GGDEF)-like protein/PAS domain S-box-containing protein
MPDSPKSSHLLTENEGPARLSGRAAVHLDAPAAERQRHARALKASEIRYRRLFETAPYGILVLESETGVVVDVNPCLCRLLGYAPAEMLDQPLWSIPAFRNAAETKNHFRELLDQTHVRYDDLPLEMKDGQIKRVELVTTLFLADNKQFVQCIVHDVTERLKQEEADGARAAQADLDATLDARRTTDQATHDEATGLVNRWYLEETLPRELHRAERARTPLTVTVLDIDKFEQINDTYGRPAGDAMLREVGRVLREHLRKSDMACRYGGQEFVLVLESSPKATVERLEQIRAALSDLEVQHGDQRLAGLTVSAGVARAGDDGTTTRDLVGSAQAALDAAKRVGGDRVVLHNNEEKQ